MDINIKGANAEVSTVINSTSKLNFGVVEWIILCAYLLAIVILGIFFAYKKKQEKNRKNVFFQPNQKVPSWVLALSLWSTILTTITFLATPINAYSYGWVFAFSQLTLVFIAPFVVKKLVPFFRIVRTSSAYEYLENRYSFAVRALCSSLFIFFNIFRVGITLFLSINAISIIIPINIHALIVIVGMVSVILTLTGGMTGIVYSDAIQALIRIGGIIIVIIYALVYTNPSNIGNAPFIPLNNAKLTFVNASIYIIFLSNLILATYNYVGSQDVVRRYKSISDPRKIRNSIIVSAVLGTLSILIFFGLGSALYSYYNGAQAKTIDPGVIKYDTQLIPYFIFTVLPGALGAFILGSILTSAQANISSGISSTTNSVVVDFIQRLRPNIEQKKIMLITKWLMVVCGILGIGIAILFVHIDYEDLITIFLSVMGLFGSAPSATVLLGMFTKRISKKAALYGLIIGLVSGIPFFVISQSFIIKPIIIFSLWSIIISFAITIISSYLLSFIWPNKKDITNLSWKTMDSSFKKFIELEKKIYAWKIFVKNKKISEEDINEYLKLKKQIMGFNS